MDLRALMLGRRLAVDVKIAALAAAAQSSCRASGGCPLHGGRCLCRAPCCAVPDCSCAHVHGGDASCPFIPPCHPQACLPFPDALARSGRKERDYGAVVDALDALPE